VSEFAFGHPYEPDEQESVASLIEKMTQGRLAPVVLQLSFGDEGSTVVELEKVDTARDLISFERERVNGFGREYIADFPCHRIAAVTLVNTEPPLDRSDELRG